jgi:vitamin B12 transporter
MRQTVTRPFRVLGHAWILLLVLQEAAWAQFAAPLPEVVVSASSLPLTEAASSQHVTVLHRGDLEALGALSVAEVLARQAGLVLDRGPRSGGYGSLYLRGADPSHVVVLVDHVRQNDPLSSRGSAVDLNTLSSSDVERIEIVRGNVSVVHAEALAGLIHIFTRRAPNTGQAGLSIGTQGLRAAQAGFGGEQLRGSLSLREEGNNHTGFHRTRAVNAGWESTLEKKGRLYLSARLSDSLNRGFPDDSGGEQFAVRRTLESRSSSSHQLVARAVLDLDQMGSLELQGATFSRNGNEASPGVESGLRDPAGLPAISTDTAYHRHEMQSLWLMPATDNLLLTLGLHHQRERGTLQSVIDFGSFVLPADFSQRREVSSIMTEARYQWGTWTVQGGLRYERPSHEKASTHPMLSLQQTLGETWGSWGLSASRADKRPSFYALGHPLVGNSALRTERATHRELYWASPDRAAWPSRMTLFSARYQDLIDFDAGPPPQLVNRDRIHADGIEWRTGHVLPNGWRMRFDGSLMSVRDPDSGARLRHRPRSQWGAGVDIPLGHLRALSAHMHHIGSRLDSSIPTGDQSLPSATTVDLILRMPLGQDALSPMATLAIDNLGNEQSPETIGSPFPGRRMRISLNWNLR